MKRGGTILLYFSSQRMDMDIEGMVLKRVIFSLDPIEKPEHGSLSHPHTFGQLPRNTDLTLH
jgi:hypothetical protein